MTRPSAAILAFACSCTSGLTFVGETAETGGETGAGAEASGVGENADGTTDDGASGPVDPAGTETAESSESAETGEPAPLEQQRCPNIVEESVYCATHRFGEGEIVLLGVDSGNDCVLSGNDGISWLPASLAWIDDQLVTSDVDVGVVAIDLETGSLVVTEPSIAVVTEVDGQLLARPADPEQPMLQFATLDDLIAGLVVRELELSPTGSGLTTSEGILFAAWHSTSFLERYDLATNQRLGDLLLEGHDDWVSGLSIVDDRLFITDGKERLREFDANSGAHVRDLALGFSAQSGLACRPGL